MPLIRRTIPSVVAALAFGHVAAVAQTSSLAPTPPADSTVPAATAIPERIDPIVTPLAPPKPAALVAPVARTPVARAGKTAGSRLATCNPGERLQRKIGVCQPIVDPGKTGAQAALPTIKAAAQPAPAAKPATSAKPAAKVAKANKPKPTSKKG